MDMRRLLPRNRMGRAIVIIRLPPSMPHLSVSAINDYLRCSMAWYGSRYGKWPQEPVFVMQAGIAIHKALTAYHREQDHQVELLRAWKECVTAQATTGSIQRALTALDLYAAAYQPEANDVVDYWFKFRIDGLPVPFIGAYDLVRADAQRPTEGVIYDWKTGRVGWGQPKADKELQPTAYWLAYQHEAEQPPAKFVYVQLRTEGDNTMRLIETTRTEAQIEAFQNLCKEVYQRMLTEPLKPTCPEGWCRFPFECGIWRKENDTERF